MADNIPFTELDFDTARENLKAYLKKQDRFKDYDFDGSNMAVLLDIMAANFFQQNVYNNMMFSEMFLDSAQIRANAMSHAKELNYVPASNQSSVAKLNLQFSASDSPSSITIPKGTKFIAQCGSHTYNFITNQVHIVSSSAGTYTIEDMYVYEGRQINEFYEVDSSRDQYFIINNENVDISSIEVTIRENTSSGSETEEFTRATTLFGVEKDDPVFYVEPHFDELYKITFGRDKFGKQPLNGNVIEISYRVSKGTEANGAKSFSPSGTIGGYSVTVTNNPTAINGSDKETIEDIKYFAPKALQTQERAVTKDDYKTLLLQRFPNIQAIAVFGGDEIDPPQYGRVVISVDVQETFGASDSQISEFRRFISEKTPVTITPVFTEAQFMYGSLDVTVYYDPRITRKSEDELKSLITAKIVEYSENNLNDFNIALRQSRLSTIIDATDNSIFGSDLITNPIIEYSPTIGKAETTSFTYRTSLSKPYLLDEDVGFDNYKPAIQSTAFAISGTYVTLQDNGAGKIIAVTSDQRIFSQDVGTVYYDTGKVTLSNLNVSQLDTPTIKFTANTIRNDIEPVLDRILAIREEDINVTINTV